LKREVYGRTELAIVKRPECKSQQTGQYQWPHNKGDCGKHYGQWSGALSQNNRFEGDWGMIMEELKRIDHIACVGFANVCKNVTYAHKTTI
jgi:hypothetical protein